MKKYFIKDKKYKLNEVFEVITKKPKILIDVDVEDLVRCSKKL